MLLCACQFVCVCVYAPVVYVCMESVWVCVGASEFVSVCACLELMCVYAESPVLLCARVCLCLCVCLCVCSRMTNVWGAFGVGW